MSDKREGSRLNAFMLDFLRRNGFYGKNYEGAMSDHVADAMRYALNNMMVGIEQDLFIGAEDDGTQFIGIDSQLGTKKFGAKDEK